jgi:hypothetical protein
MTGERPRGGESGQASIALIAAVPALVVAALAALQFALAGDAALSAANAARAAARASYVGADPSMAARAALPPSLRNGVRVRAREDHAEVRVEAPRALPFLPGIGVSASAGIGPAGGVPGG